MIDVYTDFRLCLSFTRLTSARTKSIVGLQIELLHQPITSRQTMRNAQFLRSDRTFRSGVAEGPSVRRSGSENNCWRTCRRVWRRDCAPRARPCLASWRACCRRLESGSRHRPVEERERSSETERARTTAGEPKRKRCAQPWFLRRRMNHAQYFFTHAHYVKAIIIAQPLRFVEKLNIIIPRVKELRQINGKWQKDDVMQISQEAVLEMWTLHLLSPLVDLHVAVETGDQQFPKKNGKRINSPLQNRKNIVLVYLPIT